MIATASTLKLAGVVLPLGLDTLGVSLSLGLGGLPARHRLRVALLFAGFESAMPLIGIALGAPLGRTLGGAADIVAAGLILGLGFYLLISGDNHDEGERLLSLTQRGIMGALVLGLSISLDELAIGFSVGLLRLPVLPLALAVGAQAFLMTQVGLRVGAHAGAKTSEIAERLAGVALLALGAVLAVEQLTK